jgi:ATP-binding cassette subfamily B protein
MLKLLKYLKKTEYLIILFIIGVITCNVWLELKIFDYMNSITQVIVAGGNNVKDILINGGKMLGCALGSVLGAIVINFFVTRLSAKLGMRIRSAIYDKVMSFSTAEIKHYSTASLITRTTNDITQIQNIFSMGIRILFRAPIMAIMALLKISSSDISWTIATISAVAFLVISIVTIILIVMPKFKKFQELTDNINRVTREGLTGTRVVRAFNAEKFQEKKFKVVNDEMTKTDLFVNRVMSFFDPVMTLIMNGLPLSIYIIGASLIFNTTSLLDKAVLFANMTTFSAYAIQVVMSFIMLITIFIMFPRAQVSATRVNEILETKNTIVDGKGIDEPIKTGEVQFVNVGFKYPEAEEYVLHDISFKAEKGQTIAFIGSTGSGKSTLINLVPRLYDATEGQVIVDGVNVKDYTFEQLNDKIGYISQKAILFKGSVRSNVTLGEKGGLKPNQEEIEKALDVSQAKFVYDLDGGIDADIDQGGKNVSGGQKQRLSIARAIARKPEILIFDDSFSALDYKTDKMLRAAIKEKLDGVTCLIVAQRIGTIKDADKIIVLDNGQIVGEGKHNELMKNCSVYKEIALSQLSKEELKNA